MELWYLEATHLQHVQKRRLAGVVQAEEQQLGVLVQQAEGGEDIVDCAATEVTGQCLSNAIHYPCVASIRLQAAAQL